MPSSQLDSQPKEPVSAVPDELSTEQLCAMIRTTKNSARRWRKAIAYLKHKLALHEKALAREDAQLHVLDLWLQQRNNAADNTTNTAQPPSQKDTP